MNDEIQITLLHPPTSNTDVVVVSPRSTTLADLAGFACALLDIRSGGSGVVLTRMTVVLFDPRDATAASGNNGPTRTLEQCGLSKSSDGELLISAYSVSEYDNAVRLHTQQQATTNDNATATNANHGRGGAGGSGGGGGGLDFTSLINVGGSGPMPMTAPSGGGGRTSGGGGALDFSSLIGASSAASSAFTSSYNNAVSSSSAAAAAAVGTGPVEWDGMNLDEAIQRNPNPTHLMTILANTTRHPNLLKELNYHDPSRAKQLREVLGNIPQMANVWRQTSMKSTMSHFLRGNMARTKESEMHNRLLTNPMDSEANAYFGNKIRLENVHAQYERMMEEYPESMGRVLMLYVGTKVNGKSLQVFVDSGAQNTILSSECAERLDLLHLVDERFAGIAVGVGTGKILGRIHVVEMEIGGVIFPCSFTVMDSASGLGDKNMDCLFGLDMLKRHRCSIDLGKNVLRFTIGHGGESMEAPFLHEKDLPVAKGGTLGFDPDRENRKVEARLERMDGDEEMNDEDEEDVAKILADEGAARKEDEKKV